MCTAVNYKADGFYFGRNLDLHYSYDEKVTITPRNFPLKFRSAGELDHHYAIIGTATVMDGYPLYYDATNEKGVSMAGLNFPGNAVFHPFEEGKDNVSPFEFILWILAQCKDMAEVRELLSKIHLYDEPFSKEVPLAPLHYMIAYKDESLVVESVAEGLKIYENPVGVLANNPEFTYHLHRLNDFMQVTRKTPVNLFSEKLPLKPYSLGMGSMGQPGDLSSSSRFVRAAFVKAQDYEPKGEEESVSQFFHILDAVSQPKGCTEVEGGHFEYTIYSSCVNTEKGIYYYKTYDNSSLTAVSLQKENLDSDKLLQYPLRKKLVVQSEN